MGGPIKSAAIILALALPASTASAQNRAGTDVFGDEVGDGIAAYTLQYYERAREIWTPYANEGHTEAEYRMGTLYDYGRIGARGCGNGSQLVSESRRKGSHARFIRTCEYVCKGDGVARDVNESFNWFVKAAEAGHPKAQYHVARQFLAGSVVPQDVVASYVWARRAAENPNAGTVEKQARAAMALLEPAMTSAQKEEAAARFR